MIRNLGTNGAAAFCSTSSPASAALDALLSRTEPAAPAADTTNESKRSKRRRNRDEEPVAVVPSSQSSRPATPQQQPQITFLFQENPDGTLHKRKSSKNSLCDTTDLFAAVEDVNEGNGNGELGGEGFAFPSLSWELGADDDSSTGGSSCVSNLDPAAFAHLTPSQRRLAGFEDPSSGSLNAKDVFMATDKASHPLLAGGSSSSSRSLSRSSSSSLSKLSERSSHKAGAAKSGVGMEAPTIKALMAADGSGRPCTNLFFSGPSGPASQALQPLVGASQAVKALKPLKPLVGGPASRSLQALQALTAGGSATSQPRHQPLQPLVGGPATKALQPLVGGPASRAMQPPVGGPASQALQPLVGGPASQALQPLVGGRASQALRGPASQALQPLVGGPASKALGGSGPSSSSSSKLLQSKALQPLLGGPANKALEPFAGGPASQALLGSGGGFDLCSSSLLASKKGPQEGPASKALFGAGSGFTPGTSNLSASKNPFLQGPAGKGLLEGPASKALFDFGGPASKALMSGGGGGGSPCSLAASKALRDSTNELRLLGADEDDDATMSNVTAPCKLQASRSASCLMGLEKGRRGGLVRSKTMRAKVDRMITMDLSRFDTLPNRVATQ